MNLYRNSILIGIILFGLEAHCQTIGPWDTNVLFQTPSYSTTTDVEAVGMTSLYYETIDYLGDPVETFAYYSAPDGPVPAGGWPAVVLVHGGGHSASANYVQVWNDNGFAAIAMDTEGRLPKKINGVRVVAPKPGPRRDGVWDDSELPIEDQWYYHAVALIIKGHSLIRSFPEVNPNKTGVSGFSWGGTLTSTVMGVDNRFSFAVPVYGAGFLSESDGHQGTAMSAAEAVVVDANFDGRVYFDNVTYPTMWVNGTNDHHFAITTQQKSSRAVNGPSFLRYTLGMAHGGTPPRLVEEIYAFAQNVVNGAPTLPILGNPQIASNTASVTFSANSNVTSGKLYYTLDEGKWNERQWNETNASVSGNTISANVPSGATTIYFGATNSLGYVTSEYLLTDGSDPGGGTTNLALNGTATQSTTLAGAVASRANDGDTNGNFGGNSVSAAEGPNAWWEVDLGDNYEIDDINVFNRTNNCCSSRLSDFTVSVINSGGTTTFTQTITTAPNPSVTLDAGGVTGQVVRIQSNLTTTLNLAEVEVYGSESSKLDQTITFNLPAKQLGDADFDPATASSGYNISYTSSNTNVATIVNGNIRIVGVGTSEITASQAGNVVYNPAPSVTRTLVVTDGNTGGTTNLALNGTATQSTTLGGAEASRAIDGDTNGNFSGGSISAAEGPNAWWEVDLGGNYNIDDINVFNRTNNCCSSRLSDFTVSVINSSGTTTYTQTITTAPNPSVTLDAGGAVGQVVRIQSNLTTTLNLAEVEVYGSQSNTNNTITIQENTTGFCDVDGVIQSADAGYTGSGYANTSNALGRAIDWEIDGTAGSYTFVWRYLVGSARTADLIVDGTTVATGISFVNTQGGWLTAEATVGLGAGVKSVILSSTSSTGLAKIDYLEVTGPNVVASACASSSLKTSLDLKAPDTDTEDILHFYPNPTTDILHVEVNGSNDAQLDIINSSGQNVISKHMGNGRTSVDMTRLPLGLYILKVTDQKQVRTKKIIKK
ncbi:discoidin domain-containing protein [Flagellimonas eckloniae]|uniref:F5/8 type C domain-containing protein n=1 Tax=Flagellimonas eckloniae TaxID=346185 RepID=A0A0Q0XC57_9FLAO|nr:discoidin domain-containing protein [Allomuricauda eckloniae]KQC28678.1 hypothetical protein AAY42_01250 [Allomuricauda eckloniae]